MSFENNYSWLDRVLHRLAFATRRLQIDFALNEDRAIGPGEPARPLFVTGLPRAGTTLLLDRFAGLADFAAHTYRDMPFVLVPVRWQKLSGGFQETQAERERAHGDGMLVSADSPEAFEEMLSMGFYPERYAGDRLKPWGSTMPADFRQFFANHMRKIAAIRRPDRADARYVSKNNLNILRVRALRSGFPDADIVVPYRAPLAHAASLLRQHRNFLDMHAQDKFARAYMAGVGHFDFGANLKPINFDGWLDSTPFRDPLRLDFWLAYWVASYRHLLAQDAGLIFVSHAALCADPAGQLSALATRLQLGDPIALTSQASAIHAGSDRMITSGGLDPALLAEAAAIESKLDALRLPSTMA